MKSILPLCSILCVALLACGGPEEPWTEPGDTLAAVSEGLVSTQGSQVQGSQVQGSQVQGTSLDSVSVMGATLNGVALQNLKVVEGGLVAQRPESISGWTASLDACSAPTSGLLRSCGFTSYGVGRCTPGAPLVLGGGAGGYGTCTGDPMLRVCSGSTPCEPTGTNHLISGDDTGPSLCPSVSFVCPNSGVYNVMAGGYSSTGTWTMRVEANQGQFPALQQLENVVLKDALLSGTTAAVGSQQPFQVKLLIGNVINAKDQPFTQPNGQTVPWEPSGKTWLYDVRYQLTGSSTWWPLCPGGNGLAVAVAGVFTPDGTYDYSHSSRFTFACDTGVAAKCYRWGYRPWKPSTDPVDPDQMKKAYWACTRMARADYCGDGRSFTQNNTLINMWDDYGIQTKEPNVFGLTFEAGWNTQGAVCLSHERWAKLGFNPNLCASGKLYAPQYLADGTPVNLCPTGPGYLIINGHRWYRDIAGVPQPCASVCDNEEDGDLAFDHSIKLFNDSKMN